MDVATVAAPLQRLLAGLAEAFGTPTGKMLLLKSTPIPLAVARARHGVRLAAFWPTNASADHQEALFVAVQQLIVEEKFQDLHLDMCAVSLTENCPDGLAALALTAPAVAEFALGALNRGQSTFGFLALGPAPTLYLVRERNGVERIITLQPGDLLLMARDAVHAGAFYADAQYRYYFALLSASDAARVDETFAAPDLHLIVDS